jgi:putative ABC transport system permease protein
LPPAGCRHGERRASIQPRRFGPIEMTRERGIRRLLHIQRDGASIDRAVDDELQFHFDMTVRELMAGGMKSDDAQREAERRFGDVQRTRERLATIDRSRVGRERRVEWWSAFAQDMRYALRGLRKKPGFALAVIVTLGLGIGANATMFSIVDRLLFRPPAFLSSPDRATRLYLARMGRSEELVTSFVGYRVYLDLKEASTSFDLMTPFTVNSVAIGSGNATREMNVGMSGAEMWKMFDAKPVIGRFFTEAEDTPTNPTNVVVLSFAFWQTQFGGRNDALGAKLDIGAAKYTVVGVAPEGFTGFSTVPVVAFVPFSAAATAAGMSSDEPWYSTYRMSWFEVFARRKAGVIAAAASSDLTKAFVRSYTRQREKAPRMLSLERAKPHAIAGPVLVDRGPNERKEAKVATWLIGVAGIVLLIACANVANLMLARALRRRREIAVRVALGVSRSRLMMQLITESLLLSLLGAVAGIAVAQWGGRLLGVTLLSDNNPLPSAFADARLLLFSIGLAILSGLTTGLAPVFHAGREDVAAALKAGAREGTVQRSRLRIGLLITQAALSVVLLVGAGLFVRSLMNVQGLRLGYDGDRLLWVDIEERGVQFDSVQNVNLRRELLARARAIPSVEHAANGLTVPFWSTWNFNIFVPGIDSVSRIGNFNLQAGSADFFQTMGTRIVRGRGFAAEDRAQSPLVMVVGEAMAKKLWPGQDPIGKCVKMNADTAPCRTVVGVAEDVRRSAIGEVDLHYYMPITQFHQSGGGVFVRTRGRAADAAEEVRRTLQQTMPGTSYVTVTPLSKVIAPQIRSWKMGATLFAAFGALALVLAAIGLYSVIAYNVTQRTHEMGVRVALGAQARDVVSLIVREGLWIVIPGVVLGTIVALVASRWIAPLLFNVSPKDPPVLAAVITTLLGVAVLASWVPAQRASRVDPNEALRSD